MADFNWVTGRLAVGGALYSSADVTQLLSAGVTHIVNCQAEQDDAPLLAGVPVLYLWNGQTDDGVAKPVDWFDRALQFAVPALAVPGKKVYVHCAAGVNRAPSVAYAILRALGVSPTVSESMIRGARPMVGIAYKGDADRAIAQLGW